MKLVVMMYLEEDERAVQSLMASHDVQTFSSLSLEGHGSGTAGWYGEVAPYHSRMMFTLVPADRATALMDAVRACTQCQDPNHPIHALQLDVEDIVHSGEPEMKENKES